MDTSTAPPGFIPDQQGQGLAPPMMVISQQQAPGAGNHYSTGGHVGPVIGVLAVIAVLGIIAGLVGRLCSGRTVMGYGPHFDVEAWVETKCSSCLDGHVAPPRHSLPPMHTHMAMESLPTAAAAAGWRPPENVSMRQHSHSQRRPQQQPQQQQLERTDVHLRPENVSMRPHLQSDRQPHGLHEEVLLRPLPTRRVPLGNVSDSAAAGRAEPEITLARDQEEQLQQPVDDGVEDEDEDEISDSSGHDDEHHHHNHHHEEAQEQQQQHHQLH